MNIVVPHPRKDLPVGTLDRILKDAGLKQLCPKRLDAMTRYPIAIIPDRYSDGRSTLSVRVPDLPGCQTFGDSLEQAIAMAQEAAEGWVLVATDHGEQVPAASRIEDIIARDAGYTHAVWAFVEIETTVAA